MEELDALNMLLRLIGNSPVNSLTAGQPDVANATATLDRIRKRVQKTEWWFNRDYDVTFVLNTNNEILIPSQVTSLEIRDNAYLVKRGNKLYDTINNTFKFDCDQVAYKTIRLLDWADMPDSVQEYCAYFAGSEYVRDEIEDTQKEDSLKISAKQAMTEVKNQHLRECNYNIFNASRVVQARAGVQPYHRNNKRFYGDPDV